IKDRTFEGLQIPFAVVASDIENGEEIILEKGDLVEAVRASISIPVIFTPVKYRGRYLTDGGLVNPVPVDVVRKIGADLIVAVNVISKSSLKDHDLPIELPESRRETPRGGLSLKNLHRMIAEQIEGITWTNAEEISKFLSALTRKGSKSGPPNMIDIVMQVLSIYEYEIARLRLLQDRPDILIEPDTSSIKSRDYHRAAEAIQVGEEAARKALPEILKAIS
ncbi:MAG: patatin-like phospholipase family protein, partial [Candidatus Auribacterota bacterium]|nr:patatin-like phospholipase family protein [Candidatus Auribacterota bacterium]